MWWNSFWYFAKACSFKLHVHCTSIEVLGHVISHFSRAHTIVGITFTQKFQNAAGEDTTKTAVTNLVDLAGRYGR